jgi:hypothetical protein
MIQFFTPYDFGGQLVKAYDAAIMSLPGEEDWAVLMDGDTLIFDRDFGHVIQEYTRQYPEAGMFTCLASRCHYKYQTLHGVDANNDSLLYHRMKAEAVSKRRHRVTELWQPVAGHLMVIRKGVWMQIRAKVLAKTENHKALGVDTNISWELFNIKKPIYLMEGLYILHYLRFLEGQQNTTGL